MLPFSHCACVDDRKDLLQSVYKARKVGGKTVTSTILAGQISAHSFKLEHGKLPDWVKADTAAFFEEELAAYSA